LHPLVIKEMTLDQLSKFMYSLLIGLSDVFCQAFHFPEPIRVAQALVYNALDVNVFKGLEDIQSLEEPLRLVTSPTVEQETASASPAVNVRESPVSDMNADLYDIGASMLYQDELAGNPTYDVSDHLQTSLGKRKRETDLVPEEKRISTKSVGSNGERTYLYRNNGERIHARAWYKMQELGLMPTEMHPDMEYSTNPQSEYQKLLTKLRNRMRGNRFGKPKDPEKIQFSEPRNVDDKIQHILRDLKALKVISETFTVDKVADHLGNIEMRIVTDGYQKLTMMDLNAAFIEFYGVTNVEREQQNVA